LTLIDVPIPEIAQLLVVGDDVLRHVERVREGFENNAMFPRGVDGS